MDLLDELSGGTRDLARAILKTHPEWHAAARVERTNALRSLVVELAPPSAGRAPLLVWTDDDEVTVCYDRWHQHFDTWAEIPEEEGPSDARAVVEALLAERLAVAVTMRGEEWLESRTLGPGEVPPVPPLGARTYVRSWAGSRDAEFHAV